MRNLKLKQQQIEQDDIKPALRLKLNKMLEEAGIAFDKTYVEGNADQNRMHKLRQRARTLAKKVLYRQENNLDALNLLGRIALDEGQLDTASSYLEQGLTFDPNSAALNYSRAHVYLAAQEYQKASTLFTRAEALAPNATRAQTSLAHTKTKQGLFVEAFGDYRALIKRDPTDPHIRSKLFECIRHIKADYYSVELEEELIGYLGFNQVDHNDLSNIIVSLLVHKYDLLGGNSPLDPQQLSQDVLLNKALRVCQFSDPIIEEFLTACRQCILQESINRQKIDNRFMEFLVSISLQCITNEFVYAVSLTEEKVLQELTNIVTEGVTTPDWQTVEVEYPLLLLSMYSLLHHYNFRDHLLIKPLSSWSLQVQSVLDPHLYEPQKELEIKRTIETLTPIKQETSCKVGAQYEASPYPRWTSLAYATKTDYGHALSSELRGFTPPSFFKDQTLKVLIAGCGTGRHAIAVASNFRNIEVTAIDLSRSSLAYATKMARQRSLTNIEFLQADILELDSRKMRDRYHIIECSGVLHHMDKPLAGWKILSDFLVPGGLMKIGLYSQRARQIVTSARETINENQLTPSDEHIRIFRQAILENQISGDYSEIKQSDDFYNLSGCKDLLFHVIEHHYTPIDLANAVKQLNLDFLGFVNLPHAIKQQFDHQFGGISDRRSLDTWDQLEQQNPQMFGTMYQFYVQLKSGQVTAFPE